MAVPENLRLERPSVVAALGIATITAYFGFVTWAVRRWEYEQWMVIVLAPVLVAAGAVIIAVVTRRDEHPLTGLLVCALVVKLAASFVRHYVSFSLYGSGDALRYDAAGAEIATSFHRAEISVVDLLTFRQGTQFLEDLTGLVYSLMGPSQLGGFLVFSWLGFWGLFLFHRAALVGVPDADQRRYAALGVLPSVARVLAFEHRQGGADAAQPRLLRVRRGPACWSAVPAGGWYLLPGSAWPTWSGHTSRWWRWPRS